MIITSTTITILEFVCRDLRGAAFRGDHATVRRSRAEGAVESTGARACVECAFSPHARVSHQNVMPK